MLPTVNPACLYLPQVYSSCVLLSKKRYVGYSYESATQARGTPRDGMQRSEQAPPPPPPPPACLPISVIASFPTSTPTPLCPQTAPIFDAKGIETVRRDTCPAVAKMMEAVLRLLFTTKVLAGQAAPESLRALLLRRLGSLSGKEGGESACPAVAASCRQCGRNV